MSTQALTMISNSIVRFVCELSDRMLGESSSSHSRRNVLILSGVVVLIVALRILFLSMPVLIDPSDARYAHIAEHMVIDDQWLSPTVHAENGVQSYWSKPPLGFWAMASSMSLLGSSEFAARFPALLATILSGALISFFVASLRNTTLSVQTLIIFLTTPFVFAMSGSTLVDPLLMLFTTGMFVAFGFAILRPTQKSKAWLAFAYICLGLGILTKGPIAGVFPTLSLLLFIVWSKRWNVLWQVQPVMGAIIVSLIVAPWFVLMERSHPGFTRYFLIEENVNRLVSSNVALKSGSAHRTIPGFALLCTPLVAMPWIFFLLNREVLKRLSVVVRRNSESVEHSYVLSWVIAPLVFLSVGKQVLIYYLLPLIPIIITLIALFASDFQLFNSKKIFSRIYWSSLGVSIVSFLATCIYQTTDNLETFPAIKVIAILFFVFAVSVNLMFRRIPTNIFSRASVALVMAIVGTGLAVSEPLAEYNSSAALFEYLTVAKENSEKVSKKVLFLYEAPPSSYFYSYKMLGNEQLVRTVSINGFWDEIQEGSLVSRDRNFKLLPLQIQSIPYKRVGKWLVQEIDKTTLNRIKNRSIYIKPRELL